MKTNNVVHWLWFGLIVDNDVDNHNDLNYIIIENIILTYKELEFMPENLKKILLTFRYEPE